MSSPRNPDSQLSSLRREIIGCNSCPRLRTHCLNIAEIKRKSFLDQTYWGKPITGFGDSTAELVLIGLAPAAHGANRTGRIFTGDRSGDWLFRALHKAGLANQPTSTHPKDGLELRNTYITCVVKCAPPENKPAPREIEECQKFLRRELEALKQAKVYLALGQIGMNAAWPIIAPGRPKPKFGHGKLTELADGRHFLCSYHPSQQNTFTGRLTEPMFDAVFTQAKKLLQPH